MTAFRPDAEWGRFARSAKSGVAPARGRGKAKGQFHGALLALALLLAPARASAYSEVDRFEQSVAEGGSAGRYFTGSLAERYTCAACHVGGEADVTVEGFLEDGTPPLSRTDLRVRLPEGAFGAIAIEVESEAEFFVTVPSDDLLEPNEQCSQGTGDRVPAAHRVEGRRLIVMDACGATDLRVGILAPEVLDVPAYVHIVAVTSDRSTTPTGDATFERSVRLAPPGTPPGYRSTIDGGCAVGGRRSSAALTALMGCTAAIAARSARRRPRRRSSR